MILWGSYPILAHHFVRTIDPLFLVGFSSLIASFPFIISLIIKKKQDQLFSPKNLKLLAPVALFSVIGHVLLFAGTKLTSGINTGLLLQVEPIYALIIATLFFGEVLGKGRVSATILMVFGAMVIVYKGGTNLNIGDLFILLTTLMYQISHTLAKKLLDKGFDRSLVLAGRQLFGSLMLLVLLFITNSSFTEDFSVVNFQAAIFLGLYVSVTAFLWYTAIKRVSISVVSSFLPLTAIVSLLGSVFFLHETISTQQYVGFFLILTGAVWLTSIIKKS